VEGCKRLKTLLPKDVQETFAKYEPLWAFWHPEYKKAVDVYYHNFICRMPQWPEEVARSFSVLSVPVYFTMWGPNEFTCIGALRYWDVTDKIHQIKIPCLIITAKYDEVTPNVAKSMHAEIKNSKLVLLDKSAHLCMWDEREKFIEVMRDFLGRLPQHS